MLFRVQTYALYCTMPADGTVLSQLLTRPPKAKLAARMRPAAGRHGGVLGVRVGSVDDRVKIRACVAELLHEQDDRAAFADGESLIEAGRLDSFAVVKLVMFLETTFAVDFTRIEFDPQRFDTVDAIAAMVEESRQLA